MDELQERISNGNTASFYMAENGACNEVASVLSGLANNQGGSLLLGVKVNGKINGILPEAEITEINDICTSLCKPELIPTFKTHQIKHYLLLEVIINVSDIKIQTKSKDGAWEYYSMTEQGPVKANKIIKGVWHKSADTLSNELTGLELGLFRLVDDNGPVTLSQLYKLCDLELREVDKALINIIAKGRVAFTNKDGHTYYTAV